MYLLYQHTVPCDVVRDELAHSRDAAERYRQLSAAKEARRLRRQDRRAARRRARRDDRFVPVA